MYNDLIMIDGITDYSGVCILITKALEEEMFKRFFIDFIKYLQEKYGTDYSKYHTALTYNGRGILHAEKFTMGSIPFVLLPRKNRNDSPAQKSNNEKVLLEYCKKHIFSNKKTNEIKDLLKEYSGDIEKIKNDYRNPSAHRNQIKKIDAKECFDLVLDVEKLLKKMLDSFDY